MAKIKVEIRPGIMIERDDDFVEVIRQYGKTSWIVHYYTPVLEYIGAGYMTVNELETWINKFGFDTRGRWHA